jgi:hypothetical protein
MIAPESKRPRRFWTDDGRPLKAFSTAIVCSLVAIVCGGRNGSEAGEQSSPVGDSEYPDHGDPQLQVALVRQAVNRRDAVRERCRGCGRTPLVGERVYVDEGGVLYCELCRVLEHEPFLESRIVHGPEFGHTMRVADHRAA